MTGIVQNANDTLTCCWRFHLHANVGIENIGKQAGTGERRKSKMAMALASCSRIGLRFLARLFRWAFRKPLTIFARHG